MRLLLGLIAVLTFARPGPAQEAKEKPALTLNVGGHTGRVQFVAFRSDDRELVSIGLDRTIRIWDVETGESTKALRLPAVTVTDTEHNLAGALSADGKHLAVSSVAPSGADYWIYLIDLDRDKITRVYKGGHAAEIDALAFSPDGRWLASGGNAKHIVLWDRADGSMKKLLHAFNQGLAFSPDSQVLASHSAKAVKLWSVGAGELIRELEPTERPKALAWSPDGRTLAVRTSSVGAKKSVYLWSAAGQLVDKIALVGKMQNNAIVFHPALNTEVLVGTKVLNLASTKTKPKQRLRTWLKDEGGDEDDVSAFSGATTAVAWSKRGLAALAGEEALVLWSTQGKGLVTEPERRLQGRGVFIRAVAWGGASNSSVAWSTNRSEAPKRAFDLSTLRLEPVDKTFQGEQRNRGALALERGGKVDINVKRGAELIKVIAVSGAFATRSFSFCGDGAIAVGGESNCRLFDVKSGMRLGLFPFHYIWGVASEPQGRYFVAGGMEQTLFIGNARTGTPLASLYVAGNDWIVWTPEGYYAASPGGESLMGWQVSPGPEQLAVFYPAEQFRKSLYRPDVIKLLLKEGSLPKALEAANQAANIKSTQVSADEILPPRVTFLAPGAGIVKEATVEVQAAAESTGKDPVTALRLFVNDRPFEGLRGVKAFRTVGKKIETWTVPLAPGPNKLMVIAESSVSKSAPATLDITYEPAQAPVPKKSLPNLFLLAVGINQYTKGWELQCCVNDATQLAKTVAEVNKLPKLFGKVETKLITDQAATRQGILDGLTWLKDNARAHDVVILFYAGHGETDDDGDFFLLSSAWAPDKQKGTTVSGKELKERLADLPCRVLLMLDACKSGAAGQAKQRVPPRIDKLSSELTGEVGAVVMFAAGSNELAGEDSTTGHGYFTLAVLEALRGQSDRSPKDGIASLNELLTYVEYRVPQLSNEKQHPTADKPGNVRSFSLALCLPPTSAKE